MSIVIVGAGELGKHLALNLTERRHNITVIESSESIAAGFEERIDATILVGNGASVATQAEANVADCELFVSLTRDDHTNLVAASIAKSLGAAKTIARVRGEILREEWMFDYRSHFRIDHLVCTERLGAVEMAKYIQSPDATVVEEIARGRIELQQCEVSARGTARDRRIVDLNLPARTRIAYIQRAGRLVLPSRDEVIRAGDLVTVYGHRGHLDEALEHFGAAATTRGVRNVVIMGGGDHGITLAQMLPQNRYRIRIIEQNRRTCRSIAEFLPHATILHGDATSMEFLREEQIGEADFFVATSGNDEDNVMACLQAKNLGVEHCVALIDRGDYAEVISRNRENLGLLGVVSPRTIAGRELMRFVPDETCHVICRLSQGIEVIEFEVLAGSGISGRVVQDVEWPVGSGLMAIVRGSEAFVPIGSDRIEPGDVVYAIITASIERRFKRLIEAAP